MYGIWDKFIVQPLRMMYMSGPRWGVYGFWAGATESAVCAELTGYDQIFWAANSDACMEIIDKKFFAFQTTLGVVAYFWVIYNLLKCTSNAISCYFKICYKQDVRDVRDVQYIAFTLPSDQR